MTVDDTRAVIEGARRLQEMGVPREEALRRAADMVVGREQGRKLTDILPQPVPPQDAWKMAPDELDVGVGKIPLPEGAGKYALSTMAGLKTGAAAGLQPFKYAAMAPSWAMAKAQGNREGADAILREMARPVWGTDEERRVAKATVPGYTADVAASLPGMAVGLTGGAAIANVAGRGATRVLPGTIQRLGPTLTDQLAAYGLSFGAIAAIDAAVQRGALTPEQVEQAAEAGTLPDVADAFTKGAVAGAAFPVASAAGAKLAGRVPLLRPVAPNIGAGAAFSGYGALSAPEGERGRAALAGAAIGPFFGGRPWGRGSPAAGPGAEGGSGGRLGPPVAPGGGAGAPAPARLPGAPPRLGRPAPGTPPGSEAIYTPPPPRPPQRPLPPGAERLGPSPAGTGPSVAARRARHREILAGLRQEPRRLMPMAEAEAQRAALLDQMRQEAATVQDLRKREEAIRYVEEIANEPGLTEERLRWWMDNVAGEVGPEIVPGKRRRGKKKLPERPMPTATPPTDVGMAAEQIVPPDAGRPASAASVPAQGPGGFSKIEITPEDVRLAREAELTLRRERPDLPPLTDADILRSAQDIANLRAQREGRVGDVTIGEGPLAPEGGGGTVRPPGRPAPPAEAEPVFGMGDEFSGMEPGSFRSSRGAFGGVEDIPPEGRKGRPLLPDDRGKPNRSSFLPEGPGTRFKMKSRLFDALRKSKQRVMTPPQFEAFLKKAGIRPDEIEWTGLGDAMRTGTWMTRRESSRDEGVPFLARPDMPLFGKPAQIDLDRVEDMLEPITFSDTVLDQEVRPDEDAIIEQYQYMLERDNELMSVEQVTEEEDYYLINDEDGDPLIKPGYGERRFETEEEAQEYIDKLVEDGAITEEEAEEYEIENVVTEEEWAVFDPYGGEMSRHPSEEHAREQIDEYISDRMSETDLDTMIEELGIDVEPDPTEGQPAFGEGYMEPGGHSPVELLLELPPEMVDEPGEFSGHHWDDKGLSGNFVVTIRGKTRTLTGPGNERINAFGVEEHQSDWHQQGAKEGYATPRSGPDPELLKKIERQEEAVRKHEDRARGARLERVRAMREGRIEGLVGVPIRAILKTGTHPSSGNKFSYYEVRSARDDRVARIEASEAGGNPKRAVEIATEMMRAGKLDPNDVRTSSEIQFNKDLGLAREGLADLRKELRGGEPGEPVSGIPRAPFSQTRDWVTLAVRRAIGYAAERGHDAVAWTPSFIQAKRWSNAIMGEVDKIRWAVGGDDTIYVTGYLSGSERLHTMIDPETMRVVDSRPAHDRLLGTATKPAAHITRVWPGKVVSAIKKASAGDAAEVVGDELAIGAGGFEDIYEKIPLKELRKVASDFGAEVIDAYDQSGQRWITLKLPEKARAKILDEGLFVEQPKPDQPAGKAGPGPEGVELRPAAHAQPPLATPAEAASMPPAQRNIWLRNRQDRHDNAKSAEVAREHARALESYYASTGDLLQAEHWSRKAASPDAPQPMYGGIPIPPAIQRAMEHAASTGKSLILDPSVVAETWGEGGFLGLESHVAPFVARHMNRMGATSRALARNLGLDEGVRVKFARDLGEVAKPIRQLAMKLRTNVGALKPEKQVELWAMAEKGIKWPAPYDHLHDVFERLVRGAGDYMLKYEFFEDPQSILQFREPGGKRYVKRMPSFRGRRADSEAVRRWMKETAGSILRGEIPLFTKSPGMSKLVKEARRVTRETTQRRTDYSTEEVAAFRFFRHDGARVALRDIREQQDTWTGIDLQGRKVRVKKSDIARIEEPYIVGLRAILQTVSDQGDIWTAAKMSELILKDPAYKNYVADAMPPGKAGLDFQKVEGRWWFGLNGKYVHRDLRDMLEALHLPSSRNGLMKFIWTLNSAFKVAKTLGRGPEYLVKQAFAEGPVMMGAAGLAWEWAPYRFTKALKQVLDYLEHGTITPAIERLQFGYEGRDQFLRNAHMKDLFEGGAVHDAEAPYGDLGGSRRYFIDWLRRGLEQYEQRMYEYQERVKSGREDGSLFAMWAEQIAWLMELSRGFDVAKLATLTKKEHRLPRGIKISGEGAQGATSILDAAWRLALYDHLTDRGPGGLGRSAARAVTRGVQRALDRPATAYARGMDPDAVVKRIAMLTDPLTIKSPFFKAVRRFTYGGYPYMAARFLTVGGGFVENPIGASGQIFTAAMLTGIAAGVAKWVWGEVWDDEETEAQIMREAYGDKGRASTIAAVANDTDDSRLMVGTTAVTLSDFPQSFIPFLNTSRKPGESIPKWGGRSFAATNPFFSWAWELTFKENPLTGKEYDEVPSSRMLQAVEPFVYGAAGVNKWLRSRESEKRAIESGRAPSQGTRERVLGATTGMSWYKGAPTRSRGARVKDDQIESIRENREWSEKGGRTIEVRAKPERPGPDATDEERQRYRELMRLWRRYQRKIKRR